MMFIQHTLISKFAVLSVKNNSKILNYFIIFVYMQILLQNLTVYNTIIEMEINCTQMQTIGVHG